MENIEDYKLLEGEFGEQINLIDFTKKNIINSYGGDLYTGFAAYDLLKPITDSEVGVIGVCASSGTIALLGATQRWGTSNSKFSIHNPWANPTGDAAELRKVADELQAEQDRLVSIYVNELTIDEDAIKNLMFKDEMFDAQKALTIGLIHEIKSDGLEPIKGKTAKEMFFNLKENEMNKEDLSKELDTKFESFTKKIKNLLGNRIKNLMLMDVTGVELEFDVETEDQITEGTAVTSDGASASGEAVMSDGRIVVFVDGVVTEIKEVEPDEMEALKAENEALKAEIEAGKVAQNETAETIQNLEKGLQESVKEMAEIKNLFSKKINNLATPEDDEQKPGKPKTRSAFKKK